MPPPDSILKPAVITGEEPLDRLLRPSTFESYIGQRRIKESLLLAITAAKQRSNSVDHVLLYGPPGLGKTSLAYLVAAEMGSRLHTTSGPAITRGADLAAIVTALQPGDVLFIDEIHRLNRNLEEILYPAMEEQRLDILLGKGATARSLRLDLPPFTIIGATTKAGALSHPLRDRFGLIHRLDYYEEPEIEEILEQSSRLLSVALSPDARQYMAQRSRKTPRVANRLLRRVRDFAQVNQIKEVDIPTVAAALTQFEIDAYGLDHGDRLILDLIHHQFNGGPVGLETLAAAAGEEKETIEEVIEPYLLRIAFLERTPRGRVLTENARIHLGVSGEKR